MALARARRARVAREVEREAAFRPKTRTHTFALGRQSADSKKGVKKWGSTETSRACGGGLGAEPPARGRTSRIRH